MAGALAASVERARQNSPKLSAPDLSSLYRETTRRSSGYIATSAIAHTSSASTRPSPSLSRSAKRWERLSSSGALKCVLDASSFITAAVGGGARGTAAAASVSELPRRRPICNGPVGVVLAMFSSRGNKPTTYVEKHNL